jgi:hypothetical protein
MCVAVGLGVSPLDSPSDVGDKPVWLLSVADTVLTLGLAVCGSTVGPVLAAGAVGICVLVAGVLAADAAGAVVVDAAGEAVADPTLVLGAALVLGTSGCAAGAAAVLGTPGCAAGAAAVLGTAPAEV